MTDKQQTGEIMNKLVVQFERLGKIMVIKKLEIKNIKNKQNHTGNNLFITLEHVITRFQCASFDSTATIKCYII